MGLAMRQNITSNMQKLYQVKISRGQGLGLKESDKEVCLYGFYLFWFLLMVFDIRKIQKKKPEQF